MIPSIVDFINPVWYFTFVLVILSIPSSSPCLCQTDVYVHGYKGHVQYHSVHTDLKLYWYLQMVTLNQVVENQASVSLRRWNL